MPRCDVRAKAISAGAPSTMTAHRTERGGPAHPRSMSSRTDATAGAGAASPPTAATSRANAPQFPPAAGVARRRRDRRHPRGQSALARGRWSTWHTLRRTRMTKPKKLYVIDEEAGVLDEVQGWFLALADNEGWVYTSALRQLVNRMYRDRDYQEKRTRQGRHTAYDYALDRDQKALAWAIRALRALCPCRRRRRCLSRPRNHAGPRDACRRPSAKPQRASPVGTTAPSATGMALTSRLRPRLRGPRRERESRAMHDQHPYASSRSNTLSDATVARVLVRPPRRRGPRRHKQSSPGSPSCPAHVPGQRQRWGRRREMARRVVWSGRRSNSRSRHRDWPPAAAARCGRTTALRRSRAQWARVAPRGRDCVRRSQPMGATQSWLREAIANTVAAWPDSFAAMAEGALRGQAMSARRNPPEVCCACSAFLEISRALALASHVDPMVLPGVYVRRRSWVSPCPWHPPVRRAREARGEWPCPMLQGKMHSQACS